MASSSLHPPSPARPGLLLGVGVGPGDPQLLTLQALSALREADRVVAPTTAPDSEGRAESVVRQALPDLAVDRIPFSMTSDDTPEGAAARADSHQGAADRLVGWLDAGETVAFVTLGDPNVYSTFPSVAATLLDRRPGTRVETLPGICAFQALASATGTVLLDGTETLALVTALDGTAPVKEALSDPSRAVVVYKGGRHLPEIAALLADQDRLEGAVVGELLGLPGQTLRPVAEAAGEPASYLATVIVPPAPRRLQP